MFHPSAHLGVRWNCRTPFNDIYERPEKSFGLSKAQVELEANIDHSSNQSVTIKQRPMRVAFLGRFPIFQDLRLNPKIDLASIHQWAVIIFPITFVMHGLPHFLQKKSVNPCFFLCE